MTVQAGRKGGHKAAEQRASDMEGDFIRKSAIKAGKESGSL